MLRTTPNFAWISICCNFHKTWCIRVIFFPYSSSVLPSFETIEDIGKCASSMYIQGVKCDDLKMDYFYTSPNLVRIFLDFFWMVQNIRGVDISKRFFAIYPSSSGLDKKLKMQFFKVMITFFLTKRSIVF